MYHGNAPMLTRGAFASFLGGPNVTSTLSLQSKIFVSVHPFSMSISIISQILFIFFKRHYFNKINSASNFQRSAYDYQRLLKNTLLSGFNNAYTTICILFFTVSIGIWMALHYAFNFKSSESVDKDLILPRSIAGLLILLMVLNLLQFVSNPALR